MTNFDDGLEKNAEGGGGLSLRGNAYISGGENFDDDGPTLFTFELNARAFSS